MIKSELVTRIGQKLDQLSEYDIALCVNAIIQKVATSLAEGERVEVRDFGSFTLRLRAPRLARNPKTGETLYTKEKYAIHFKPGKGMKERIDASKHLPITEARKEAETEVED